MQHKAGKGHKLHSPLLAPFKEGEKGCSLVIAVLCAECLVTLRHLLSSSYYRQKFLASTGKRAWIDAGNLMDHGKGLHTLKKAPTPQRGKVTPMSAFAGAARISVMNDKELEAYVETLRGKNCTWLSHLCLCV